MGEIFLKVFNMSVSACFPAAAIVLGRVLFKKAPRFVFPILWAAAALRLILPFSFQSPMSLMPGTEAVSITRFDSRPFIESGFEAVDRPLNDMLARNYHEGVTAPLGTTQKVLDILAAIWLSAAAAMLLYMILKYIFLYAKMKTAVRIYRNIYQSEYARSPFVLGIFAPKIYIPFSLKGRNADLACAHELSHISRLDHIWKPLGFIILSFHWFNPMVWLGYALFCRDIEMACDEKTVKNMGLALRADYAEALLYQSSFKCPAAFPPSFGCGGVKARIKTVLTYTKPSFALKAVCLFVCAAAAVFFLADPVSKGDSLTFSASENPPYGFSANYRADLGRTVKSGKIYAEQWQKGECVCSSPMAFTQYAGEFSLTMTIIRQTDHNGVNVEMLSDQYGGSQLTWFEFPEDMQPTCWSFKAYDENERLYISAGESRILAVLAFDMGDGIRVFDCGDLSNSEEKLAQYDYAIVIKGDFRSSQP